MDAQKAIGYTMEGDKLDLTDKVTSDDVLKFPYKEQGGVDFYRVDVRWGIKRVVCSYTPIRELNLSGCVKIVRCVGTDIKKLTLPYSINKLSCDSDVRIENLEKILWHTNADIRMYHPGTYDENRDMITDLIYHFSDKDNWGSDGLYIG